MLSKPGSNILNAELEIFQDLNIKKRKKNLFLRKKYFAVSYFIKNFSIAVKSFHNFQFNAKMERYEIMLNIK